APIPNDRGVFIWGAPSNTIGGTTPAARNIISGNTGDGVFVYTNTATLNVIEGNYIGTNITGTIALANQSNGVDINGGVGNTVGGATPGARNIISGNNALPGYLTWGLLIWNNASTNSVEGNYIGTDVTGTVPLANGEGIFIYAASGNVIGGVTSG